MIDTQHFIEAARLHVDTVLMHARDRWGQSTTPLLADGLHVATLEPVRWTQHGQTWILCNPASQQNFLRVLNGLGELTDRGSGHRYTGIAHEIVRYELKHMRQRDLMWWGGHCVMDLQEKQLVFCNDGSNFPRHELKRSFPFYELLFAVDPVEAARIIRAQWNIHVYDWRALSFDRHGVFFTHNLLATPVPAGTDPWDMPYSDAHITSQKYTFMPAGIDLVLAAAQLSMHSNDRRPLLWARRLSARYVQANLTTTGLPCYIYNSYYRPRREDGTTEGFDRASTQLSQQLGRPIEERMIWKAGQIREAMYCMVALVEISVATQDPAFGDHAVQSLEAFVRYAFDAATGMFHPILTDGTRLSGMVLDKTGYFGKQGQTMEALTFDAVALLAYAYGYRHRSSAALWQVCNVLAARLGLGNLGPAGAHQAELNLRCGSSDPMVLFALLTLHQATGESSLLQLAIRVGNNIVSKRQHGGLFIKPQNLYAQIDALEPLALLHLAQIMAGKAGKIPTWFGGFGQFHALFDGVGRTTDSQLFYRQAALPARL